MIKNLSTVLIWSENYRALADWYSDKLGLTAKSELNHPDDTGVLFQIGTCQLWIGQHSKVHGKNSDPHRHMFNLDVDSVTEAYIKLKSKNVEFIATPFKAPTFNKWFATFCDLDGNLVQLFGDK